MMTFGVLNQCLSLHYCKERPPEKQYSLPSETIMNVPTSGSSQWSDRIQIEPPRSET